MGNCTIFARYVETGFATQAILNARLTRFYEREDWKLRLQQVEDAAPMLLERGLEMGFVPDHQHLGNTPSKQPPTPHKDERLAEAARITMRDVLQKKAGHTKATAQTELEMNL